MNLRNIFRRRPRPAITPLDALTPSRPDLSRLAILDGVGSRLTDLERAEHAVHMSRLAAPLVDTAFLAETLADGDRHDRDELRALVQVTPDGGLVHGDLTGGAR